jgi:hypothetical protein
MTGQLNVQKLKEREAANKLENSDRPMLGLIELARLNIDQLVNPQNTQNLKNKLQGARTTSPPKLSGIGLRISICTSSSTYVLRCPAIQKE